MASRHLLLKEAQLAFGKEQHPKGPTPTVVTPTYHVCPLPAGDIMTIKKHF